MSKAPASESTVAPSAPTADENRRLAEAEAARLLSLAQLPPGAGELHQAPDGMSAPSNGTPATSSLIDHVQFWRVPLTPPNALAWFRAHSPVGFSENGSSSSGGPGQPHPTVGIGFWAGQSAADSTAWVRATLEVGITAADEGASYVRLDGMTEWLDPVPMKVAAEGPRMRIAVDAPCPKSDRDMHGVRNQGDDLASTLLPSGDPEVVLICSYAGLNGTAFALTRTTTLGADEAVKLASAIAHSSLSHLDNVVTHCPMDDGSTTVLAFRFVGRRDVDIWYHSTGCRGISNGNIGTSPSAAFTELAATYSG